MPERDRSIDVFKGLLILWVIHIHTVFWTGDLYLSDSLRQMSLLIDVPVFFFISGYLMKPRGQAGLFRGPARQFARLYARYVTISCLIMAGLFTAATVTGFAGPADLPEGVSSMLRVWPLGALWDPVRVFKGNLWFIRDYLSMLFLVPCVAVVMEDRRLRLAGTASLAALFFLFSSQGWDHRFVFSNTVSILFYLLFFTMGAAYRREEDSLRVRHLVSSLALTVFLCATVYALDGGRLALQENKFPPTFRYLLYSLPLVHLFALAVRWPGGFLPRPARLAAGFLTWCGVNVFAVYLFQGVACSLPYLFVPALLGHLPPFGVYAVVLTFNIFVTLALTFLYVLLETRVTGTLRSFAGRPGGP